MKFTTAMVCVLNATVISVFTGKVQPLMMDPVTENGPVSKMNSEPEIVTNIIPTKTVCNVNGIKEIQKCLNSMPKPNFLMIMV